MNRSLKFVAAWIAWVHLLTFVWAYGSLRSAPTAGPPIEFSLGPAEQTVSEGSGAARFEVSASRPVAEEFALGLIVESATAEPDADFRAPTAIVRLRPGERTASFQVELIDDRTEEPPETFAIRLAPPRVGRLGVGSVARVTILDDDVPTPECFVEFESDSLEAAEAEGGVDLTLRVTGPLPDGVSLQGRVVTNGTAAEKRLPTGGGLLKFSRPVGGRATARFVWNDDRLHDVDATYEIQLVPAPGVRFGAKSKAGVTVRDDDPPPTIAWVPSAFASPGRITAAEGEKVVLFLTFSGGSRLPAEVEIRASVPSAAGGTDAVAAPVPTLSRSRIVFAAGDAVAPRQTVELTFPDDDRFTPGAIAELKVVPLAGAVVPAPVLRVELVDNDGLPGEFLLTLILTDDYPLDDSQIRGELRKLLAGAAPIGGGIHVVGRKGVAVWDANGGLPAGAGGPFAASTQREALAAALGFLRTIRGKLTDPRPAAVVVWPSSGRLDSAGLDLESAELPPDLFVELACLGTSPSGLRPLRDFLKGRGNLSLPEGSDGLADFLLLRTNRIRETRTPQ